MSDKWAWDRVRGNSPQTMRRVIALLEHRRDDIVALTAPDFEAVGLGGEGGHHWANLPARYWIEGPPARGIAALGWRWVSSEAGTVTLERIKRP